jgi:hypothetical protein
MKATAIALLLFAPWAIAQTPEKKEPPAKAEQPKKPLILRIDQLPASERAGLQVQETAPARTDNLPDLGGKPSSAYDAAGARGSGTSAPGSPYPVDAQPGGK